MNRAIVLIWLGAAASRPSHQADLESWARSRTVTLEDPSPDARLEEPSAEIDVATRVESLLAEARATSYGADPAVATAALEAAELLLRNHPALPQAAWLMAETCRAQAALVRGRDPALAATLAQRAEVLEGARALAFGEEAPNAVPSESPHRTPLPLVGMRPSDVLLIDGNVTTGSPVLAPGEHHVRVLRRGQLAWSGWVESSDRPVILPLPLVTPCAEADFERVGIDLGRVALHGPVLCDRWAVARVISEDRIEVARCTNSRCGTLLPWSRAWDRDVEGPMQPAWPHPGSRAWIGWTVLSAAVLAAGGAILVSEGVFDTHGPPHDTVTLTGPRAR